MSWKFLGWIVENLIKLMQYLDKNKVINNNYYFVKWKHKGRW